MSVLVKAGTEIHDENGDLVATVAQDISDGDLLDKRQFKMADGHIPVDDEPLPKAICDFLEKFLK